MTDIQESYERLINLSRCLDNHYYYCDLLVSKTRLNLSSAKVWDLADLDQALDGKLKIHSGDSKKCEDLREAHARIKTYIQFNIDYMDEYVDKLDRGEASGEWLEAFAERINDKAEGSKMVKILTK